MILILSRASECWDMVARGARKQVVQSAVMEVRCEGLMYRSRYGEKMRGRRALWIVSSLIWCRWLGGTVRKKCVVLGRVANWKVWIE